MAALKGNDLAEWIKDLKPVLPEDFQTMEQGTKIIRLDSQTMEPVNFEFFLLDGEPETSWIAAKEISESLLGTGNWFYYPIPEEPEQLAAQTKGKVVELGGKWKNI